MAHAARVFDRPDWLASARRALDFIRSTMWKDDRLLATHKDGKAHLNAYLDDYAFLLAALLEVLQADFRADDLAWAEALGDALLESFQDAAAAASSSPPTTTSASSTGPSPATTTPPPRATAWRPGRSTAWPSSAGETRFRRAAEGTLALFWPAIERSPAGFGSLLAALEETLRPPTTVIVNGPAAGFGAWREALRRDYRPDTMVLFVPGTAAGLPPPLAKPAGAAVNAWVCEGVTCLPPIAEPGQLRETLKRPKITGSAPTPNRSA